MKTLLKLLLVSILFIPLFSPSLASAFITKEECQAADLKENPTSICKYGSNVIAGTVLYGIGRAVNGPEGAQLDEIESPEELGAIHNMSTSIAYFYDHKPASSAIYVADVVKNFGASPVYAQGIGFSGLDPVLQVWKAFRNLSYFLFILVFIAIGFMIMFRSQVNHQAVVTVQMALPKIIVTLVLITFSYAIAGLVIDLIYVLIYFMTAVFSAGGIIQDLNAVRNALFTSSIWDIGTSLFAFDTEGTRSASQGFANLIVGITPVLNWVTDLVMWVFIGLAVLIALFRTFFQLLGSYVAIILSVIFAPLQLLPNAFPGNESFKGWITNLLANAAVFPVMAAMVLIGAALVGGDNTEIGGLNMTDSAVSLDGWVPPFINGSQGSPDSIRAIIGIGIVMLLPTVGQITKQMLGVEASPFSGQVIGSIFAAPKMLFGAGSGVWNMAYQWSHIKHLRQGRTTDTKPTVDKSNEHG